MFVRRFASQIEMSELLLCHQAQDVQTESLRVPWLAQHSLHEHSMLSGKGACKIQE
jgi:hypothetical protein